MTGGAGPKRKWRTVALVAGGAVLSSCCGCFALLMLVPVPPRPPVEEQPVAVAPSTETPTEEPVASPPQPEPAPAREPAPAAPPPAAPSPAPTPRAEYVMTALDEEMDAYPEYDAAEIQGCEAGEDFESIDGMRQMAEAEASQISYADRVAQRAGGGGGIAFLHGRVISIGPAEHNPRRIWIRVALGGRGTEPIIVTADPTCVLDGVAILSRVVISGGFIGVRVLIERGERRVFPYVHANAVVTEEWWEEQSASFREYERRWERRFGARLAEQERLETQQQR